MEEKSVCKDLGVIAPEIKKEINKNPDLQKLDPKTKEAIGSVIKEAVGSIVISATSEESFSGPIPHPETLKKYIQINPKFGNKIFEMAEAEATHRRTCDRKLLDLQSRGQIFAFIIALGLVGAGIVSILHGQTGSSVTIFGGTILGLVALFFTGPRQEDSKRERPKQEKPKQEDSKK